MVSIFAEEIVNTTETISVTDGQIFGRNGGPFIDFEPFTINITPSFLYVEKIKCEIESLDSINIERISPNPNNEASPNIRIRAPTLTVGGFTVFSSEVFGEVLSNSFVDAVAPGVVAIEEPVDAYIGSQVDVKPRLVQTDSETMAFEGAQTLDFNIKVEILGRSP